MSGQHNYLIHFVYTYIVYNIYAYKIVFYLSLIHVSFYHEIMKKPEAICIFMIFFILAYSSVFSDNSPESLRKGIVETAKSYLGTKYHYGGLGKKGFDCSGFVHHVYLQHDIPIPRMSHNQFRKGTKIEIENARPADLVFFSIRGNQISHVGIYLGDNEFIHSPSRGKEVQVTSLDNSYWKKRFRGAATYIKDSTKDGKN